MLEKRKILKIGRKKMHLALISSPGRWTGTNIILKVGLRQGVLCGYVRNYLYTEPFLYRDCDLCDTQSAHTPYEGLCLANQINRKLGVFDRKLEGSHCTFYCYSSIYDKK